MAANYAPAVGFLHDERGRVERAYASAPVDEPRSGAWLSAAPSAPDTTAGSLEVHAKVVVNATGVWADELRRLDDPAFGASMRPAKGIHLTVPRDKLPCDLAAVLPVPKDRRTIFVVPWDEHTYIGTTDTEYDGPLDDPRVEPEDVAYVLRAVNAAVSSPLAPGDVTATWAGLRPLLAITSVHGHAPSARTADLSRRHQVQRSRSGPRVDHRGQAHDLPQDGGRHGGRCRARARIGPRTVPHQAAAAARLGRSRRSPGTRAGRPSSVSTPRCWTPSGDATGERHPPCSASP